MACAFAWLPFGHVIGVAMSSQPASGEGLDISFFPSSPAHPSIAGPLFLANATECDENLSSLGLGGRQQDVNNTNSDNNENGGLFEDITNLLDSDWFSILTSPSSGQEVEAKGEKHGDQHIEETGIVLGDGVPTNGETSAHYLFPPVSSAAEETTLEVTSASDGM